MSALHDAVVKLEALAALVPRSAGRVLLDIDADLAWIRIDNAPARNALTIAMMVDLARAVQKLQTWDGRAIILGSAVPHVFCSGGHLDEVQRALLEGERGRQMSLAMTTVLDALHDNPAVVIAAIDGAAVGGGAELVTAADFRVASAEARINFVHVRLGVAPGWGGAARLARIVGRTRALKILYEAHAMDPVEAHAKGLVDAVVEGTASDGAVAMLKPLRTLPIAALRAVKAQVVGAGDPKVQADRFAEVWGGLDHRAALAGLLGGFRTK